MANKKIYSDLAFKPSLNNEGDLTQVFDQESINQSLYCILNTMKGTRLMDPEFGCNFKRYLFDMFDTETLNSIIKDITDNFRKYESRIVIDSIDRNLNFDSLQYTIQINYRIINKNETGKFVVNLQKL